MIRHMRHGSPPRFMAPEPIGNPNSLEAQATLSAGDRITYPMRCCTRAGKQAAVRSWMGGDIPDVARAEGPHIFLSYSSTDAGVARQLVQALRSRDLKVFFDRDYLTPGQE